MAVALDPQEYGISPLLRDPLNPQNWMENTYEQALWPALRYCLLVVGLGRASFKALSTEGKSWGLRKAGRGRILTAQAPSVIHTPAWLQKSLSFHSYFSWTCSLLVSACNSTPKTPGTPYPVCITVTALVTKVLGCWDAAGVLAAFLIRQTRSHQATVVPPGTHSL